MTNTVRKIDNIEAQNVANEIFRQMGGNRFRVMTGSKVLRFTHDDKSLKLYINIGANSKKIRTVLVEYIFGKDLYNMAFYRYNFVVASEYNDVYSDMLAGLFEKETGLYTRL